MTHTDMAESGRPLLLCLSHLRWDWVYQRPQHLMTRAAATHRVVFFEEPLTSSAMPDEPVLRTKMSSEGVLVATPVLPAGLDPVQIDAAQRQLLDELLVTLGEAVAVLWYYTPMALDFAGHVEAELCIFDSMDELSAFNGASPRLLLLERRLLRQADLVFTGGRSLHEAKRSRHPAVSLFPSSVDALHFAAARGSDRSPADQAPLPRPRIGFFGVIDERMDLGLVGDVAAARPDWQFVMLGPVAKVDPAQLPRLTNVHWLGMKPYADLPLYLSGWDAGMMPFALNTATQYISPTKTPEYLAAGVPVVSTAVPDVVHDWGSSDLVAIGGNAALMVQALAACMERPRAPWIARVDQRLALSSWDTTWGSMSALIEHAIHRAEAAPGALSATLGDTLHV